MLSAIPAQLTSNDFASMSVYPTTPAIQAGKAGDDAALDGLLHPLESPYLNLPHPLTRDAELVGELFERDRLISEAASLENAALALVEHAERPYKVDATFSMSISGHQQQGSSHDQLGL
jgi:hypothetical protein